MAAIHLLIGTSCKPTGAVAVVAVLLVVAWAAAAAAAAFFRAGTKTGREDKFLVAPQKQIKKLEAALIKKVKRIARNPRERKRQCENRIDRPTPAVQEAGAACPPQTSVGSSQDTSCGTPPVAYRYCDIHQQHNFL